MNDAEFGEWSNYVAGLWRVTLNPKTLDAWYDMLKPYSKQAADVAIAKLIEHVETDPRAAHGLPPIQIIIRAVRDAERELRPPSEEEDRRKLATQYPESPYLRESKKLIYGAGKHLLLTPTAELDEEGAGIKAKILDCGQRHYAWLNVGRTPTGEMLQEVTVLALAAEGYYAKHKDRIDRQADLRSRLTDARRTSRLQPAGSPPSGRKGR